MKYYGAPYEGIVGKYDLLRLQAFDDPYSALEYANRSWNAIPDNDIARLLIVIEADENMSIQRQSFFQFTDAKACCQFVAINNQIVWSDIDMQQWNGNARMMNPCI